MRLLFRHFLLLGVIFGLIGQGVAFAATPCAQMQRDQSAAMAGMPDCAMGENKTDNKTAPCKDMTPGCLAMTGCAALAAVDAPLVVVMSPPRLFAVAAWPTTATLHGRDEAPIPEPPTILG